MELRELDKYRQGKGGIRKVTVSFPYRGNCRSAKTLEKFRPKRGKLDFFSN